MDAQLVLDFWFNELEPAHWWKSDMQVDLAIKERFSAIHAQASQCELSSWRSSLKGRIAEIIVLDQFSRNLYRNSSKAFENDALALGLAQEAVKDAGHSSLSVQERTFLYMPFMHSESLAIHAVSMRLHEPPEMESRLIWEIKHRDIIKRFGRYPHRNKVLGRASTNEELEFLSTPGSSF